MPFLAASRRLIIGRLAESVFGRAVSNVNKRISIKVSVENSTWKTCVRPPTKVHPPSYLVKRCVSPGDDNHGEGFAFYRGVSLSCRGWLSLLSRRELS
eukprot:scaffold1516_cov192-Alexandrium_tamarense.AAC.20